MIFKLDAEQHENLHFPLLSKLQVTLSIYIKASFLSRIVLNFCFLLLFCHFPNFVLSVPAI